MSIESQRQKAQQRHLFVTEVTKYQYQKSQWRRFAVNDEIYFIVSPDSNCASKNMLVEVYRNNKHTSFVRKEVMTKEEIDELRKRRTDT